MGYKSEVGIVMSPSGYQNFCDMFYKKTGKAFFNTEYLIDCNDDRVFLWWPSVNWYKSADGDAIEEILSEKNFSYQFICVGEEADDVKQKFHFQIGRAHV